MTDFVWEWAMFMVSDISSMHLSGVESFADPSNKTAKTMINIQKCITVVKFQFESFCDP